MPLFKLKLVFQLAMLATVTPQPMLASLLVTTPFLLLFPRESMVEFMEPTTTPL